MNKPNFQDRLDEIIKEAKGVMFDDNDFRTLRYIAPPEVTKTALTQLFKDYIKDKRPDVIYPEVMEYVELLKEAGDNRDVVYEAAQREAISEYYDNLKGGLE